MALLSFQSPSTSPHSSQFSCACFQLFASGCNTHRSCYVSLCGQGSLVGLTDSVRVVRNVLRSYLPAIRQHPPKQHLRLAELPQQISCHCGPRPSLSQEGRWRKFSLHQYNTTTVSAENLSGADVATSFAADPFRSFSRLPQSLPLRGRIGSSPARPLAKNPIPTPYAYAHHGYSQGSSEQPLYGNVSSLCFAKPPHS